MDTLTESPSLAFDEDWDGEPFKSYCFECGELGLVKPWDNPLRDNSTINTCLECIDRVTKYIEGEAQRDIEFPDRNNIPGNQEAFQWRDKVYNLWSLIKNRCNNPLHPEYPYYGGKGIRIADPRWILGRSRFFYWTRLSVSSFDATFHRRDTNGHFDEFNCYWKNPPTVMPSEPLPPGMVCPVTGERF